MADELKTTPQKPRPEFIGNFPPTLPPFNPISIIFDIVGFILGLLGLGKVDLQPLADAINNTWGNLIITGGFLYNAIRSITVFFQTLIKTIVSAIIHIISDILHGHLLQALKDIQKLFHDLQTLFAPIFAFIERVRAWYYKYIYRWQKLAINIISKIRVILEVFRLLGAKWAAKLDADLAKIQGYITDTIVAIVGTLNKISTILGLVVDPGMLIRGDAFGGTLWQNLGLVKKAAGYGSSRPLFPDEKQVGKDMKASVYGDAPQVTVNPDGSVVYDPALKLVDDGMTHQMQTLGIAH